MAAALRLDKTFVSNVGSEEIDALGEVFDTAIVGLQGDGRFLGGAILVIDRVFIAYQFLTTGINIGTSEVTLTTLFIVKFESAVELEIVVGITETAIAVRIPKQSVVLIRKHEWDRHLGVILEEVFVLTLHIELLALMLTEAVESLIIGRVELHLPGESVFLFLGHSIAGLHTELALGDSEIPELLSVLSLSKQLLTIGIEEGYLTGGFRHHCLYVFCLYNNIAAFIGNSVALGRGRLRHNHERGRFYRQSILGCSTHTDDVVVHHLEFDYLSLTTIRTNSHIVSAGLHLGCHR